MIDFGESGFALDRFNRQLHPGRKTVGQEMAANSNGKYTAEQIEAQMRLSSLVDMNVIESVRPDVIDAANAKPIASSVQWQSGKASDWSSDAQKKIN